EHRADVDRVVARQRLELLRRRVHAFSAGGRLPLSARRGASVQMLAVEPGEETFHAMDDAHAAHRRKELEGVLRAGDLRIDEWRACDAAEGFAEQARLADGDHGVEVAVNDEE